MVRVGGKIHELALHRVQEVLGCLCLSMGYSELTTAALEKSQRLPKLSSTLLAKLGFP